MDITASPIFKTLACLSENIITEAEKKMYKSKAAYYKMYGIERRKR